MHLPWLSPQDRLILLNLSQCLSAGVSPVRSFELLVQSSRDASRRDQTYFKEILRQIRQGRSPQKALDGTGFPREWVEELESQTSYAVLGRRFSARCRYYREDRADVQAALRFLLYPIYLFMAVCLPFISLGGFVLPQFRAIFNSMNMSFPPVAEGLMTVHQAIPPSLFLGFGGLLFVIVIVLSGLQMLTGFPVSDWSQRTSRQIMVLFPPARQLAKMRLQLYTLRLQLIECSQEQEIRRIEDQIHVLKDCIDYRLSLFQSFWEPLMLVVSSCFCGAVLYSVFELIQQIVRRVLEF